MKRMLSVFLALLMLAVWGAALVPAASAAVLPTKNVSVPVTIKLTGTQPSTKEDYTVKLKPDDTSYPMPADTEDGICAITITGAGTKSTPVIEFNRVGIYSYTIYQVKGENKKCTYDDTVYSMTVYITNSEDGSGLEATVIIREKGEDEKLEEVVFTNKYKTSTSTLPKDSPKTDDESNFPLYALLAVGCVIVLAALFVTRKRNTTEE
ncbi:MAG: FctA domain-containing protein [Eubacteriales bacterium]|nr:FctA domain-containing protein [Eubacteriales bacterium]